MTTTNTPTRPAKGGREEHKMTLKQALEQAINAGYLYVTDRGTNADGELWCIDEFITSLNPDADDAYDPHTYELEHDVITEYK